MIFSLPVFSSTLLSNNIVHDGTPDRLVILCFIPFDICATENKLYHPLTEKDTTNIEILRDMGFKEMQKGNYKTSLGHYKKILLIDSSDYDAGLAIANLYYKMNEFNLSIDSYNDLLIKDKADVEAMIGLGRCYYRTGDYDLSVSYFSKAINHLPLYVPTYFDLATSLIAMDKLDSAIIVYKRILKIDDTYAEAWAGVGKMLYWKGYPKSALEYYSKAVKLDPTNKQLLKDYKNIENETITF